MNSQNDNQDRAWDRGWHEHKTRQLMRLARLSFAEKLAWLENAQALADAIASAKNKHANAARRH